MRHLIKLTLSICSLVVTSCGLITEPGVRKCLPVRLPAGSTITDVHTGVQLQIDSLEVWEGLSPVLYLRKGQRFALRIDSGDSTAYITTTLKRHWWAVPFNIWLTLGAGFAVDQLTETAYLTKPDTLQHLVFRKETEASKAAIEDSLQLIERFPLLQSVVDKRTEKLAYVWGGLGFGSSTAPDNVQLNDYSLNVGYEVLPYVLVCYHFQKIVSRFSVPGDPGKDYASMDNISHSLGLCLQEKRYGVFATVRYGLVGTDWTFPNTIQQSNTSTATDQLSFGAGIFGQWGRLEYRHSRMGQIIAPLPQPELQFITNAVYYSFQVVL